MRSKRVLARLACLFGILLLAGGSGCFSSGDSESTVEETKEVQSSESSSFSSGPSPTRYWFKVEVEAVHGQIIVLLNGFPVYRTGYGRKTNDLIDLPMNEALVGEGNAFALRVEPWMRREGKTLEIGEVRTTAWVALNEEEIIEGSKIQRSGVDSAYAAWREQAQKKWKEYRRWEKQWLKKNPEAKEKITWKEGGALDSIRAWASRHPLTVSATFDNEAGPDFSRIFEEAPVLEDTPSTRKRLKCYAMHLRDLFARKDTGAIYREHRPSFEEANFSKQKSLQAIGRSLLKSDWHLDYSKGDLDLRSWSEGRVWEIYRDDALSERLGKRALLLAGEERLTTWHTVYVAELDGELRVVRSSF